MAESLNGKVALVTGAGVRVGRQIALELASRGCDLVAHYHSSHAPAQELAVAVRKLGRRVTLLRADLGDPRQALRLVREAEKAFGPVSILINSAAIFHATPLKKLSVAELDAFLDINLRSPFGLASELGQRMKARGQGCIVNIACLSALRPWREYVPYSLSKAGLWSLTMGLAKALAPEVRVNAVAPGTVLPPPGTSRAEIRRLAVHTPLRRIGKPEDVAEAVAYLCTASFVTGQLLCVDGGRSIG